MSQQEEAPARPLYDEIEKIRLRNGWTKVQVARNAGVSRGTIENWKTQPRTPLAPTVKDVAERLGIDPEMALRLAGIIPMDRPTPRERLADYMTSRVAELGLEWSAAIRGRMDVTQYPIEMITDRHRRAIEDALRWMPGGVDLIIQGGEPTPADAPLKEEGHARDELTGERQDDDLLTPEERRLIEKVRRDPDVRRRLLDAILAGHGQDPGSDASTEDETARRDVS